MMIRRILVVVCLSLSAAGPASATTVTRLFGFTSATGGHSDSPLVQGSDGNFYGTTTTGGDDGAGCTHTCEGTVFSLTPQGQFTLLYTFAYDTASAKYANGATPEGGLVEGPDGWLYGTTNAGGSGLSYGVVYKISKTGQFAKLHDFCPGSSCPDGAEPWGDLVFGRDGYLYGVTSAPLSNPRIYRISTGGDYQVLAGFYPTSLGQPRNGMVLGSDGNFYGMSEAGIYRYAPGGGITTLHLFVPSEGTIGVGPPIQATDGYLYGSTYENGAFGAGTVVRIALDGSNFQKVHDLTDADEGGGGNEPVIQASDGTLWGTTQSTANGSAYSITASGAFLQAARFTTDTGKISYAPLIQASDGKLYGTTYSLGPGGYGAAFVVDAGLAPPAPGEASAAEQMLITAYDKAAGDVTVSYRAACYATDHHIVYGPLSGVSSYAYSGQACYLRSLGTATFNPGVGDFFWVLVGNTLTREGSYGKASSGAERPEAVGVAGCDYPQDLSGGCP